MKINILLFIGILLAAGAYTYSVTNRNSPIFSKTTTEAIKNTALHTAIDNFSYIRLNGKQGNLYDHKGSVVLVHFWATWCAPCLTELPTLIALAKSQKKVTVLAISTDSDIKNINRFIKKLDKKIPDNFVIITDPNKEITQGHFQTLRLPETFILNPNLSIHNKIIGAFENWASPDIIEKLYFLTKPPTKNTE